MSEEKYKTLSIHADSQLLDFLRERASEGEPLTATLKETAERATRILPLELAGLKDRFSLAEVSLIIDALNGTLITPEMLPALWLEIEDHVILNSAAERWSVDGTALVEKVKALTPGQAWALCDLAERFWKKAAQHTLDVRGLRRLGLSVTE